MYKIYYSGMFYKHLLRWNCLASTSGMRSVTCLRTLFAGRFCYPFEDRHGRNTHGYYSGKDVIGIKKDFTSWKSGRVYEILGSRFLNTNTILNDNESAISLRFHKYYFWNI